MIHRAHQYRPLGEDEPERVGLKTVVDGLDLLLVLTDVPEPGGVVDNDYVHVTGDERLNGQCELVECLNPVLADKALGQLEVGRSHLSADDRI